jgi:hypothetical protein
MEPEDSTFVFNELIVPAEINPAATLSELIVAVPAEIVFVFRAFVSVVINVILLAVSELIVATAAEIEFVNVEGVLIAPDT